MVNMEDDFFIIDIIDPNYLCFMDLRAHFCGESRVGFEKKVQMKGELPRERHTWLANDTQLMRWIEAYRNSHKDLLHLVVEILTFILESFHGS